MVGNALQGPRNHQRIQRLRSHVALLFHHPGQRFIGRAVHRVHGIVHGKHHARQIGIRLDERLQTLAHHLRGQRGHAWNVHRQFGLRHLLHAAYPVADRLG